MKVKQQPSDFRVEEITNQIPGPAGDFAFYRLDKIGWTTPDALNLVRRRWNVTYDRLGYGGLKDRHAHTTQFFTIRSGPKRDLALDRVNVSYLGQLGEPYSSRHVAANRFAVTLRHLTPVSAATIRIAAAEVATAGVPNYFDDQRFGSVGSDGKFVAREMIAGRFEAALKLALAAPYAFDRGEQKREKVALLAHWGDWSACKAALPRGHARSLVDYLVHHPTDYKGAVARLRPELQGLYLAAYQSYVWNRMLDRWLRQTLPPESIGTIRLKLGERAAPTQLPSEVRQRWEQLILPLPSARMKPHPGDEWAILAEAVLAEDGLTLAAMRVPGLQKPYFAKGDRMGCLQPRGLMAEPGDDELNRGRHKLTLRFDLPRGSYATMIVKRLTGCL